MTADNVATYTEATVTAGAKEDAHAGLSIQLTNARNLDQLDGSSTIAQGAAGFGPYVQFQLSYGDEGGEKVYGIGVVIGPGAGGGGAGGYSHTTVYDDEP